MSLVQEYFRNLYERTMTEAYRLAEAEIVAALRAGGRCLDCGAGKGHKFRLLHDAIGLGKDRYRGIEWNAGLAGAAEKQGLAVIQGDLNAALEFPSESFRCIFGLSVLEHLLNPCTFLKEGYRCLEPGGTLVILTPNISTFFTVAQLLAGKMPSSGPHPDSDMLLRHEEPFRVRRDEPQHDMEADTPVHRHIVVFSFRVLRNYLHMLGYGEVEGRGFGLYPFPNFLQPMLERLDPWHCHQMVFVARK